MTSPAGIGLRSLGHHRHRGSARNHRSPPAEPWARPRYPHRAAPEINRLTAGRSTTLQRECSDTRSARAFAHSTTDLDIRSVRSRDQGGRPFGDFDRADTRGIEDRPGTLRRGGSPPKPGACEARAIFVPGLVTTLVEVARRSVIHQSGPHSDSSSHNSRAVPSARRHAFSCTDGRNPTTKCTQSAGWT
jgi:hypothetical protein